MLGRPSSPVVKGEIVGATLAGSDASKVSTIHSPLSTGATFRCASTHVIGRKRGEALSKASVDAMMQTASFAKTQLEEEHGGASKASARILAAAVKEAMNKSQREAKLETLVAQKKFKHTKTLCAGGQAPGCLPHFSCTFSRCTHLSKAALTSTNACLPCSMQDILEHQNPLKVVHHDRF